MACVHDLEHVERFSTTALADDDAACRLAERVLDEVADGDGLLALACLFREDVASDELQLCGVLDGDDALVIVHAVRKGVQERRLARACASRHEDVAVDADAVAHEVIDVLRRGFQAYHVVRRPDLLRELADGHVDTLESDRRRRDIDAEAHRREAAVDDRRLFRRRAPDEAENAVRRVRDMLVVPEADILCEHIHTVFFDKDLVGSVDFDFRDAFVIEEVGDGAEADDFVQASFLEFLRVLLVDEVVLRRRALRVMDDGAGDELGGLRLDFLLLGDFFFRRRIVVELELALVAEFLQLVANKFLDVAFHGKEVVKRLDSVIGRACGLLLNDGFHPLLRVSRRLHPVIHGFLSFLLRFLLADGFLPGFFLSMSLFIIEVKILMLGRLCLRELVLLCLRMFILFLLVDFVLLQDCGNIQDSFPLTCCGPSRGFPSALALLQELCGASSALPLCLS